MHDAALGALARRIATDLGARATVPVTIAASTKTLDAASRLAAKLHELDATRATVVLAVGGGTLTDLCGFVASIYLRGVPFVACPTTTLAMCDAALGGKNGVDHLGLKNRLGTIRQPELVLADVEWLQDLPDALFREGLVEVVKKACVLDASRFRELEELAPALLARDEQATAEAVGMAVEMKMAVVLADEREADRRRALNFGHTIGHALESLAAGAMRHGHAVAVGMAAECRAGGTPAAVTKRVVGLLHAIGAHTEVPRELADADRLWAAARRDKKAMRGSVPMYVPSAIGEGRLVELTLTSLERALA